MSSSIKSFLKKLFSLRFIRFVLVAGLNTAFGLFINYFFLYIFQDLLHFNRPYFISNFLATIVSILFNFKTYGTLVFKDKDRKRIFRFLLVTTFTYLCNVGGIRLLEETLCQNNYLNITIMAIPVGLLNYLLYSTFVFIKSDCNNHNMSRLKDFFLQIYLKYRNFLLYGLIGCLNTIVDIGVYTLLTTSTHLNIHFEVANFISYHCGIFCSFFFNRRYNFKTKDRKWRRFLSFYVISLIALFATGGVLYLLVSIWHLNEIVAKIIATILIALVQFIFLKHFTFKENKS